MMTLKLNTVDYRFFSSAYKAIMKINNTVSNKIRLDKFTMIQVMQRKSLDHIEIN